ncbi:MAG: YqgE/AlgH family protein [Paracoccus sp. (in: a-proteobacteria)]|nr:YqgE/AlgH family protein [Paracoccus sp. (in: a-proteobacteria)]
MNANDDLTGKILIAMPDMGDPRFRRSVILICAWSDQGAMGLVLNHPAPDMRFRPLMEQLGIEGAETAPDIPVRFGGPVETGRGFVLHRGAQDDTPPDQGGPIHLPGGLSVTTTRDILEDLAQGRAGDQAILCLGYAGWGPGQLDAEMRANGWLLGEMRDAYAFGPPALVWEAALRDLGVDPLMLSGAAGRA